MHTPQHRTTWDPWQIEFRLNHCGFQDSFDALSQSRFMNSVTLRRFLAIPLTFIVGSAVLSACGSNEGPATQETTTAQATYVAPAPTLGPEPAQAHPPVSDVRAAVASLMHVGVRDFDDALFALNQGVGGIFITSTTNQELLTTPGRDIQALKNIVGRDFRVSIDFEGGRVLRHSNILGQFPSARVMADTLSPELVRGMGFDMGNALKAKGIDVNFAPVVDVDTLGLDVVGDRAFSDNPERVAEYATNYARGLRDAGVLPVFKHFPGHGRASGDSHHQNVVTPPLAEMMSFDLAPYAEALMVEPSAVLMGHMVVPGLGAAMPSSLNPAAYKLLRSGEYPGGKPFDGIIFTDDLSGMKAITDRMPAAEAIAQSLVAGADQALWINTAHLIPAIDTAVAKVESGEYPMEQLASQAARVSLPPLDPPAP